MHAGKGSTADIGNSICKGPEAEERHYWIGGITIKAMRQSEQEGDGRAEVERWPYWSCRAPPATEGHWHVSVHVVGTVFRVR